ncbi:nucleoside diphosphate sugar epimerase family protein [Plesiocystis pacifica SIR-1]|uniref:Nucleoside diphosphate sugar epimerase family protein n=1 Tax=Plesiocystis pacifica SIR-1 TaxID=391625 RepID=A6FX88_9BACT|nr:NAD-dependent epimerase/dehydratase family protein [Plesiocystis pacifica]EDM81912.1 nucleoside diphosphate sugar epimerase family protein [Plesiocystis pacifica SIR-1]
MATSSPSDGTPPLPAADLAKGTILVTGASGHVGNNLVRRLLEEGCAVRALVQPGANDRGLEGLDIERTPGDLRDLDSLRRALDGVTRVFHVAAKISTATSNPAEQRELYAINVLGTRDLLRASLDAGVERVVLTGSFSATGFDLDDPSQPSAEGLPFYPFRYAQGGGPMAYAHTKALAEHQALVFAAEGLDVVIATSCGCIGPHDYLPSRMGGTLCDYIDGRQRAYVDGGFSWIRARDIADGHLLAMARGRSGQKYVFATGFLTLGELFRTAGEVAGVDHPLVELPFEFVNRVAKVYSGTLARFFPKASQRLTPGSLAVLRMRRRVDSSKAQRELGFEPTELRTAIAEAVEFFAREGMVRRASAVSVPRQTAPEPATNPSP